MFARAAIIRVSRMLARELVRLKLLGLAAFVSLSFSAASLAAECPDPLPEDATAAQFIACINDLKQQVVPAGAVMAFDLSSLTPDKCPTGWSPFKQGRARVMVGIGDPTKTDDGKLNKSAEELGLIDYGYRQHGGEREVTLTVAEMPEHYHELSDIPHRIGQPTRSQANDIPSLAQTGISDPGKGIHQINQSTSVAGGKSAHNNMPPYIALYFCKKGPS